MLRVCACCRRHVRTIDASCPFCGTVESLKSKQPSGARLAVAIGTAMAIGCGGESESVAPVYGAPPMGGTTSQAGANAGKGGTVNSSGVTYPSGGLLVPYGLPPLGGAPSTRVASGGNANLGGQGGTSGAQTGGANTGNVMVVYGPPPPSGGTASAGRGAGVAGNRAGGGGIAGASAITYPSGGLLPPYGLPPIGGARSGGTSGYTVSGASGKGGASAAGAAGRGASAGSAPCPAVKCGNPCPDGRWLELDGCTYCNCAPPKVRLESDSFTCPSESLVLSAVSSYYIGGIDRWDIQFTWTCSAAVTALGQPLRATLVASITQTPATVIGSVSQIFYIPSATSSSPYFPPIGSVYVAGSGLPELEVELDVTESFLVLRREGDRLVGGIYFVGTDNSGATTYTLSGAFDVTVPTM